MFNLGTCELLIIFLVILLLFGAKRLPELARGLGKGINEFKDAVETGKKEILSVEKELSIYAKRSLQATTKINKGDKLELGVNFEILRPGKRSRGIDPRFISKVNGKKSNSIIQASKVKYSVKEFKSWSPAV